MCNGCRRELTAYYGDDAIWRKAQELYAENPSLGVLGHIVFEDDNLELHHLYWSLHQLRDVHWFRNSWSGLHGKKRPDMKRHDDLADYSDDEIQRAIDAHVVLIDMAKKAFGIDEAERRVEALRAN